MTIVYQQLTSKINDSFLPHPRPLNGIVQRIDQSVACFQQQTHGLHDLKVFYFPVEVGYCILYSDLMNPNSNTCSTHLVSLEMLN